MREEDRSAKTSLQRFRRLGDCFTWISPLTTKNVKKSTQPNLFFEHSCFAIQPWKPSLKSSGISAYSVSANLFQHISLHYRFVRSHCAIGRPRFLGERLHSYAKRGLLSANPSERSEWLGEEVLEAIETVDVTLLLQAHGP